MLLAPVPAGADDAQLLGRLSKLRVALRNADHAAIAKVPSTCARHGVAHRHKVMTPACKT